MLKGFPPPYSIAIWMRCSFPFAFCFAQRVLVRSAGFCALLAVVLLIFATLGQTQNSRPPFAIGRLEGRDISVENGTPSGSSTSSVAPSIYLVNGSVLTVHSGEARLMLTAGGELDICGPAKLTLLQSNGSLTVALNFGQVRMRLPAGTDLHLFTPTIIGTPIDIEGAPRDITLGLSLDDSLCVLATSGAVQLEQQFSGEKMIVPQAGEFFLAEGKLLPVAGKPGACRCQDMQTQPQQTPLEAQSLAAPIISQLPATPLAAPPQINQTPSNMPASMASQAQPNIEFSIPVHPEDSHPINPAKPSAPGAPPTDVPLYSVVAPPLSFSAGSPLPPPEPPLNTFLLVREAHVDPQWEFRGHVDPPEFAREMQKALGEASVPTPGGASAQHPGVQPARKTSGFWGFFKKIF
jgi:hypothetical protein